VVDARSKATSINITAEELNEETLASYQKAQAGVTSALGRLIAVSENYPDLKANQNFLELQAQLEGTENRIAVERQRYNEVVKAFNKRVVTFPNNLLSSLFGFSKREFFVSQQGAETAPVVEF
jgi:LemA protein